MQLYAFIGFFLLDIYKTIYTCYVADIRNCATTWVIKHLLLTHFYMHGLFMYCIVLIISPCFSSTLFYTPVSFITCLLIGVFNVGF